MMLEGFIGFIKELKVRNDALFYFGLFCLLLSVICIVLTKTTATQIHGVNAWFKPFKFAVSLGLYSCTMAWYCHYLSDFNTTPFNWTVIVLFGLELLYIIFQASKGQLSHYNISTPTYSLLYSLMGLVAAVVTLYTAYIGLLFFTQSFPKLPSYYVWSIRLGILIFVVFSFEGGLMGSRMNHSVGAINDNSNMWLIGWSKTVGDLRVSHFIGMHALQLLPLLSFYIFKNTKATIVVSIIYGLLAVSTLVQALNGKPLITEKKIEELK
ncbi:hypothetical protein [Flavobacterium sp. 14A]|uniref:hypothetical protein n=1 Tax=Flavobacterium sp. 14A TaxID=2735896 RepID=UPI0020C664BE|nr:hypothetical protein [Flavobacterium sp. 14A]NRT10505.1 hypothetical protein [Flavobacterium sp. 14A]